MASIKRWWKLNFWNDQLRTEKTFYVRECPNSFYDDVNLPNIRSDLYTYCKKVKRSLSFTFELKGCSKDVQNETLGLSYCTFHSPLKIWVSPTLWDQCTLKSRSMKKIKTCGSTRPVQQNLQPFREPAIPDWVMTISRFYDYHFMTTLRLHYDNTMTTLWHKTIHSNTWQCCECKIK